MTKIADSMWFHITKINILISVTAIDSNMKRENGSKRRAVNIGHEYTQQHDVHIIFSYFHFRACLNRIELVLLKKVILDLAQPHLIAMSITR